MCILLYFCASRKSLSMLLLPSPSCRYLLISTWCLLLWGREGILYYPGPLVPVAMGLGGELSQWSCWSHQGRGFFFFYPSTSPNVSSHVPCRRQDSLIHSQPLEAFVLGRRKGQAGHYAFVGGRAVLAAPLLLACITEGGFLQLPALDTVFVMRILSGDCWEEPAHWGKFSLCLWLPEIFVPLVPAYLAFSSWWTILAKSFLPACTCPGPRLPAPSLRWARVHIHLLLWGVSLHLDLTLLGALWPQLSDDFRKLWWFYLIWLSLVGMSIMFVPTFSILGGA